MAAPATAAQVHEALTRTDIMALATLDEDGGSWTSPVQFRYDEDLHLYFASLPDAGHDRPAWPGAEDQHAQHDARAWRAAPR
jgi:hypothetical protein